MAEAFRIGIAGLGTVGAGVVKIVQENGDLLAARAGRSIEIACVSAKTKDKDRGVDLSFYDWVDDVKKVAAHEGLDAVVELIGGSEDPAKAIVSDALQSGRHVVTANKALMAHHGFELACLAEKNNVCLSYEAGVAGCIPVIKAVREGLAANRISAIYGILNGTSNYILTQMRETGRNFDDVLKEAQEKGYAEADPTFDIDGVDAGHKICLLAALGFGTRPDFDNVQMNGIRNITSTDIQFAQELGYKIKLLGIAKYESGKVLQSVEPCLVPAASPLGAIEDVYNAVFIAGNYVETPLLTGRGAGEGPTASAVMADIIDLARGQRIPSFSMKSGDLKQAAPLDMGSTDNLYYLRLTVLDQPGVIADVSAILRDKKISIEGLIQHGRDPDQPVSVVLTTHETRHADMMEAAKMIGQLKSSVESPAVMRIERDL